MCLRSCRREAQLHRLSLHQSVPIQRCGRRWLQSFAERVMPCGCSSSFRSSLEKLTLSGGQRSWFASLLKRRRSWCGRLCLHRRWRKRVHTEQKRNQPDDDCSFHRGYFLSGMMATMRRVESESSTRKMQRLGCGAPSLSDTNTYPKSCSPLCAHSRNLPSILGFPLCSGPSRRKVASPSSIHRRYFNAPKNGSSGARYKMVVCSAAYKLKASFY